MKSTKEGFIPYIYIKGQYKGGKRLLKSVIFFSSKMLTKKCLISLITNFWGPSPNFRFLAHATTFNVMQSFSARC